MPKVNHPLDEISGKQITLNEIKGKNGTLIIFSCNTCPWVIRWEDRYVEIASSYLKRDIGMIVINSNVARFNGDDSLHKMKKHAKEKNYNFPYAQDPNAKLAYSFGATKTPHVYLFDNKDNLVYRGAIDDNARNKSNVEEAFLINALDQMLAGERITKSVSKALGCSIKF
ncbi:MAG: redoxin family protein [Candidatus Neomarinimicrobiota bacterium]